MGGGEGTGLSGHRRLGIVKSIECMKDSQKLILNVKTDEDEDLRLASKPENE